MHHFFLILAVFATIGGKPEVRLVAHETDSLEACNAVAPYAVNSVSQQPGVTYVTAGCIDVVNPKEKAA